MRLVNIHYPLVADRQPVGVLPQVLDYMAGFGHGRFAVNDPGLVVSFLDMGSKRTRFIQLAEYAL